MIACRHGLPGPSETHRQRHERKHSRRRIVVVAHEHLVHLGAQRVVNVPGPGHANRGMDEQRSAHGAGGAFGELLVDAVHGVARLKGDNPLVPEPSKARPRLDRREAQRAVEAMTGQAEQARAACHIVARPASRLGDQGVSRIGGAQRGLHLAHAVVLVDLVYLEQGQDLAALVDQCNLARGTPQGARLHGQRDG